MPITEIVTPSLKQDAGTRSSWETTMQPLLLKIIGPVPGVKGHFIAPLLTENGVNVESAVKYGLGIGILTNFSRLCIRALTSEKQNGKLPRTFMTSLVVTTLRLLVVKRKLLLPALQSHRFMRQI